MPLYFYKAKKGPDEVIEGKIEAVDEKEAIEKLNRLGYVATRLEVYTPLTKKTSLSKPTHFKIKHHQITIFSRQLASLLKSGVPILSALAILREQSENPPLKYILTEVYNAIKEGESFSEALKKYPKVFSPLYLALVKTGEDSGDLPNALLRIAEYRQKEEEFLSKFRTALIYPLFMVLVGIGTVIFMLVFVLPKISQIFLNLGQELPLPTRIVLKLSLFFKEKIVWLVFILLLIIFIILRYLKTEKGRKNFDHFKLRVFLLGSFILKTELARFSRTLSLLLKNGLSVIKAIELSIPVLGNEILSNCFSNSLVQLKQGGSFGRSLKESKIIPLFMSNLISVGEESGKLSEAMEEIAFSYEKDTEDTIKVFTTLLEPILILVIGGIIGFMVIAMLLPIFEMNLAIR